MDIVVSIPHATAYDPEIHRDGFCLPAHVLNGHVDIGTDLIFSVPGVPTVRAEYPRWLGDVNRPPFDYSPIGVLPHYHPHGMRARSRLPQNREELLRKTWYPFHHTLDSLVRPGTLVLDGHAMDANGNYQGGDSGARPEICLMTLNRTSCPGKILDLFRYRFMQAGYTTVIGCPYDNGYILRRVQRLGGIALGVEVSKGPYLDSHTLQPDPIAVAALNEVVTQCVHDVRDMPQAT